MHAYAQDKFGQKTEATWAPLPGSQEAFIESPIYETLYSGARGNGKTEALIFAFARFVEMGWGLDYKGVIFRRTHPELEDVIRKSRKLIPKIWPNAKYNQAKSIWEWPGGASLSFRHFLTVKDYDSYHGMEFAFIGWEELCSWPNDEGYKKMMSCARCSNPNVPVRIRSTTNSYGMGRNWVRDRWRLPVYGGRVCGDVIENSFDDEGNREPARVSIHGRLEENIVLMHADPGYRQRISASANGPAQRKAWLYEDWLITSGGMFDDLWNGEIHIVPDIPFHMIPRGWRLNRSYDHGQSKPFSVGWWLESNGEPMTIDGRVIGPIRGDLIRLSEWYGSTGKPNVGLNMPAIDIAEGIVDREQDWGLWGKVRAGPADASIFSDYDPGSSVAGDHKKKKIYWLACDKASGSRRLGWEKIRTLLSGAVGDMGYRDEPGMFACKRCRTFIRLMPDTPRDDKDLDDVPTEVEDHLQDEVRYRARDKVTQVTSQNI